MKTIQRRFTLAAMLGMCLLVLPYQAMGASDLYKFCHHDIQKSEELKGMIAGTTVGLGLIKGTIAALSTYVYLNNANKRFLDDVEEGTRHTRDTVETFVPSTRSFFKAFVPAIAETKRTMAFLGTEVGKTFKGNLIGGLKTVNTTDYASGFTRFSQYFLKACRAWDVSAPVIIAYLVAAKSICAGVKQHDKNCKRHSKNKDKCGLRGVYNDLPDGRVVNQSIEPRSCDAAAAALQYTNLAQQLAPTIKQMRTINAKIRSVLKPLHSAVSSAGSVLRSCKAPINKVNSVLKIFKKAMSPVGFAFKKLKSVMNKKVCVKLKFAGKQTKKCSRLKRLPKTIKKLAKPFKKAFEKASKKIIDPIIKQATKQVSKLPGVRQIISLSKKMARKLKFTQSLTKMSNFSKSFPLASITTKLKGAATKINQLGAQMK